jgi:hypothetical protein
LGYLGNNALPFDPLRSSGKPLDAQRFNGNGSTTTFTLTHPVTNPTDLEVFVENVQQEPLFAYNATGTQLIFTEAPPSGTNNVYVTYRNIDPGIYTQIPDGAITFNKLANNIRLFTTDNFTGDNTTVAFTLSSAVPDANTLIVAVDGVFQRAPIHYTASGNTITFTSAPPASSNVHVRHLGFRTTQSITALPANTTISQPVLQNLTATGVSTFSGNVGVNANLAVTGSSTFSGNTNFDSGTLFVDSVGNAVGVGTTAPTMTNGANIEVANGTIARLVLNQTGTRKYTVSAGSNTFNVYDETGDKERIKISSTGNVGFGVSSPSSKLDVAGAMRLIAYQGTASTVGDGYNACRFWIELRGSGANSVVQKLFYADDNAAFKVTYIGHYYDSGSGASGMLRAVEFYGAVGSGGAGEVGLDYYFVQGNAYGTAGGTDTPTFSISGDGYVQITYGNGSALISSRGLLFEWFGSSLPSFHSTVVAP